jgi:hypothetical protein
MTTHPPSEKPLGTDGEPVLARDRTGSVATNGDGHLPTHVQHNDPENVEHKHTRARSAWNRFNGYGRKRVGFFQSIKAVVFCSCTSILIVFSRPWNLLRTPRLERAVGLPSNRLGLPLPPLGR